MDQRTQLLHTIHDPCAPLDARLEAGERLSLLGDPRATEVDRVLIPAGHFTMGGPGPDSEVPARPARRVFVSAFRIDRYPVTVAAYAPFLHAGGYRNKRYWTDAGWEWKKDNHIDKPRFWDEPEWAPYLSPNHPVVGVSAHEAEAFAAYMGARLPTEAEWERACRGPESRLYPWGSTWMEDACAMRGYGPRCTVPIGTFPRGVTAEGLSDMVGCVWQWCRDVVDDAAEPDDTDPLVDPTDYDEEAPRATRGGAWNTLPWSCCGVSRNAYPPSARFSNLGFRLVEGV